MELKCNQCVKADVCGIKDKVSNICKDITLNKSFQELINSHMKVEIECESFLQKTRLVKVKGVED